MPVSCEPTDLAVAAQCYCGIAQDTILREQVKVYLLAVIAGLDGQTPSELATSAACYCYDAITMKKVQAYLLCQAANA